jgi:tetratricopeptide (TPR) repeat protein
MYFDSILEKGTEHSEVDKHAYEFAKRGRMPEKTLISARLRTDGGYYEEALAEMRASGADKMRTNAEKTEFFYREGRIFHKLAKYDSAEISYKKCIQIGETLPRYFAANAALQLGYIYKEIVKDKEKAKFYFEKALSYPRHEYKTGIDQKANAALDLLNSSD